MKELRDLKDLTIHDAHSLAAMSLPNCGAPAAGMGSNYKLTRRYCPYDIVPAILPTVGPMDYRGTSLMRNSNPL